MKFYTCKGCRYTTSIKTNMYNHLHKIKKCSLIVENFYNKKLADSGDTVVCIFLLGEICEIN